MSAPEPVVPAPGPRSPDGVVVGSRPPSPDPLLSVRDLKKHFAVGKGLFGRGGTSVKAVDGVSFDVMPGETPYVVVDEDGKPLDASAELGDPASVADPDARAWYEDAWDSMKIAGDPPTEVRAPKDEIRAPKEDLRE